MWRQNAKAYDFTKPPPGLPPGYGHTGLQTGAPARGGIAHEQTRYAKSIR